MKIKSTQDVTAEMNNPKFKYTFKAGEPLEVPEDHASILLKNPIFEVVAENGSAESVDEKKPKRRR